MLKPVLYKVILYKNIQKRLDENKQIIKKYGKDSKEYKESDEKLKSLQQQYRESTGDTIDDEYDFIE